MGQRLQMIDQKVLGLLNHFAEERARRDRKVSFHVFDIIRCHRQNLGLLNALNTEIATIGRSEPIFLKAEVFIVARFLIVDHSRNVNNEIFCAKVLQHRELVMLILGVLLILSVLSAS